MSTSGEEKLDTAQFDAFVEGLDYPMYVVTAAADAITLDEVTDIEPGHPA